MPRANADPFAIEELREVVRMHAIDRKAYRTASLLRRRSKACDARKLGQGFIPAAHERQHMRAHVTHADRRQPVRRRSKSNRSLDVRCPRFKSVLDHVPCRLLISFFFNDTATTEIYTLSLHDALPI